MLMDFQVIININFGKKIKIINIDFIIFLKRLIFWNL